ncbi:uncharacterized protein N7511_003194 [Penicillium nucicola]|uniref:uncharacterized protein n=1 Tax=Penicillium nucicola TaxID=1850975 RepID=UPI002544F453|nr:uncharacterized protein N7511_003194 [Penicillium nucicola]KAJ5771143.1 hypothetical protein N7511_003194 [Penicillium nucicola]
MCIMACNRSNEIPNLSMDESTYLSQQLSLSPQSRPVDLFKPDPLAANWTYDSAIDLFNLNPNDMESMPFDFADGMNDLDSKDLFVDPFAASPEISGFSMPMPEDNGSLSSEIESDDQSWPSNAARPSMDSSAFETQSPTQACDPTYHPHTQKSRTSSRWSSSPEIKVQEVETPQPSKQTSTSSRKTRSFSRDSNRSSGSQDPQMRNAAKRAAHNIIEKRYRTNMNAKFVSLEQAISPAGVQKHTPKAGAGSLKKSEILSNALSYIDGIQQENQALHKELAMLKQNMLPGGMWRHPKHPRA